MFSTRLVHGNGPVPCARLLCGEGPGWQEQQHGVPFYPRAPTGEELDRLLATIGHRRTEFYLTNLYRMMPPTKGAPYTPEHLAISEPYLKAELARVRPRLIVAMGRQSARYFLGDVGIDEVWGLHLRPPQETFDRLPMLRPDVTIAPLVHIAAGFHNPESASHVVAGFEELKHILRGTVEPRELYSDAYPNPVYRQLETREEFDAWAVPTGTPITLGCDTEGWTFAPWSLQLSKTPGEGVLVRASNVALVEYVRHWIGRRTDANLRFIFHNGLHDLAVLRAMGIDVIELGVPFDDTMLRAYLLGVLPQGLKPLATRLHGMRMQSYDEVLGDAQDRKTRSYLQWLWDELNHRHNVLCEEDFEFQKRVAKRRITVVPSLPKSALLKAVERALRSQTPYQLWEKQVLDLQVEAHQMLGPSPLATLSAVKPEIAIHYASRDPDATLRVESALEPRIRSMQLEGVYGLDLATYPLLDRMMQVGIKPDPAAFGRLATILDTELAALLTTIRGTTIDPDFNPNSGDQVAAYLYDELQLAPLGRQTDSGRFSTNDKILEALQWTYAELPVIKQIRLYREYFKLRWTFVARLPELIKRWPADGRIHCDLKLTRTPSGRLAASNPNLLAMPKHGKFAREFRRCFVAEEGHVFLSNDISQAELRGLAHLSQDPVMLAIYRGQRRNKDGSLIDLHAVMAERMFGVPPHLQNESEHRFPAKKVNFGLPMGMQAQGLTVELRDAGLQVSEDDAQKWIDEADKLYTGVVKFKHACIQEAQQKGYVRCLSGRIRYIGGIRSKNTRLRAEAERFAFSTKIQESAQWIGKIAQARIWQEVFVPLRKQGHWIEPLLWIHDDLLSEMDQTILSDAANAIVAIMSTPPKGFSVPIKTDPKAGPTWGDLVKVS